jgi:hypothetical protein
VIAAAAAPRHRITARQSAFAATIPLSLPPPRQRRQAQRRTPPEARPPRSKPEVSNRIARAATTRAAHSKNYQHEYASHQLLLALEHSRALKSLLSLYNYESFERFRSSLVTPPGSSWISKRLSRS